MFSIYAAFMAINTKKSTEQWFEVRKIIGGC